MSMYRTVTVRAIFQNEPMRANASFSDNIIREKNVKTNVANRSTDRDYNRLLNQPSIEEITLIGNKTFLDLGLRPATKLEIEAILQS